MSRSPDDRRPVLRPAPGDEADVRAAFAEAERGEGLVTMTAEQFERWMTTGEGAPWDDKSGSGRGI